LGIVVANKVANKVQNRIKNRNFEYFIRRNWRLLINKLDEGRKTAKPLCVGSIPTRASKLSITYSQRRKPPKVTAAEIVGATFSLISGWRGWLLSLRDDPEQ
jgi:hypothetical protein